MGLLLFEEEDALLSLLAFGRARVPDGAEELLRHPLLDRVGRTPLVELQRIPRDVGARIFAKLESANPGGSVKDRAARGIVIDAVLKGVLPERRLLDASSGNTGIAYAMLGAALGFGVTLCLPENASPERKKTLRAYGTEVVETDPLEGTDGAIVKARQLLADRPDLYYYADQYSNPANPAAHEQTTGPEIVQQMGATPMDVFLAGLGTSGTFVGISRALRRLSPRTRRVSIEPDGPLHGLEGLKHMASVMVPSIYDPQLADSQRAVSTERAREMTRRLAREEGLLVGLSSGAALVAALEEARESGAATIVTVFPDGGDRYLSDDLWEAQ